MATESADQTHPEPCAGLSPEPAVGAGTEAAAGPDASHAARITAQVTSKAGTEAAAGPGIGPSGGGGAPVSVVVRPGVSGSICLFREAELTPARAVETLKVLESLIGWAQAQRAKVITVIEGQFHDESQNLQGVDSRVDRKAVGQLCEELAESLAAAEVGCALRIPDRTALALLRESVALSREFPATLEALQWGTITYPQARTIIEEADFLPAGVRRAFEADLLAKAPEVTRAQLARVARREREKHHPETIRARHAKEVKDRSVEVEPGQDGMCWLSAYLPAQTGIGIHNRLTLLARQCQGPDEARTLTQLRTDVFTDLLTGRSNLPGPAIRQFESTGPVAGPVRPIGTGEPHDGPRGPRNGSFGESARGSLGETGSGSAGETGSGSTGESIDEVTGGSPDEPQSGPHPQRFSGPEVLVTIDASTLAGLTNRHGMLEGYGPISPDVARDIAALAGSFTPLLTDKQGNLLAIGRKRRLPSPIVRRWLRVRDETCRFPGCNRSAANSEIDHVIPWAKVHDTHHTNLAHLCRKHHRFKTVARWNVTQHRPGYLNWTSPSGERYRTSPAVDLAPTRSSPTQSTEQLSRRRSGQPPEQLPGNDPPPF